MQPEWLQLLGSGGVGAILATILTTVLQARSSVYKNLNDLVDQLQEDRAADRENVDQLNARIDKVLAEYHAEREWSAVLYAWGLNGAPPPPPTRSPPA